MIQGIQIEEFRKFLAQQEGYLQARQSTLSNGPLTLMQDAATAIGNGTTASVTALATQVFEVSGTFTGTVTFEGLINTSWVSLNVKDISSNELSTTATLPGLYRANVAGLSKTRARITAYTSGSITVYGLVSGETANDIIPQGNLSYSLDTVGIKDIPKTTLDITALTNTVQLAIAVFSGPINLFGIHIPASENTGGCFVKLFDAVAAGNVTLGTTVPKYVIYVPDTGGYTTHVKSAVLETFNSGICISCVTTLIDSGTTAPGTALKKVKLYYV
jgi:hypothetical protein